MIAPGSAPLKSSMLACVDEGLQRAVHVQREGGRPGPHDEAPEGPRMLRGREQERAGADVGADRMRLAKTQLVRDLHDELPHPAR